MYQITPTQERILTYIYHYIKIIGYSPTVREIMEDLGYKSPSTVHNQLNALQKQGYIDKKKDSPRTIRILKEC